MDPRSREREREKTTFAYTSCLFEILVMPFGLTNAPSTFERLMEKFMRGLQYNICLINLDDIIVKSSTFEEHPQHLGLVFDAVCWF